MVNQKNQHSLINLALDLTVLKINGILTIDFI